MKPVRFAVLLMCVVQAVAQTPPAAPAQTSVKIAVDYTTAEQTLAVLTNPLATEADARKLLALQGTRAMIEHAHGFDPGATDEAFVKTLLDAAHGQASGAPFYWKNTTDSVPQARSLLAAVKRDPEGFGESIARRIAAYSRKDLPLNVTIYMIAGGGSDGFTPNTGAFYLAIDMFKGELAGASLMASHELYHLVQRAMRQNTLFARDGVDPRKLLVHDLMLATLKEGTATWVADPTRVANGGPWIAWYSEKYRRNLDHIALDFTLLDDLLYRASSDSDADGPALYRLGFSGQMDSPAYFVGYYMARAIEQKSGRARLIALVESDPLEFFRQYVAVCGQNDPPFSPAVLKLIDEDSH